MPHSVSETTEFADFSGEESERLLYEFPHSKQSDRNHCSVETNAKKSLMRATRRRELEDEMSDKQTL